jgi:hypothetical protein
VEFGDRQIGLGRCRGGGVNPEVARASGIKLEQAAAIRL